jgi:hypothetical protein
MGRLRYDAEMQAANERFREQSLGYALSLQYNRETDAFTLGLRSGVRLMIPRLVIDELRDATANELEHVALSPNGGTILCESLDVDIFVPGLVRDITARRIGLARGGEQDACEGDGRP